jgi:hypothetical protein
VPFIVRRTRVDADRFMLHLYAALAEKERALISQRTRDALKAAKAPGVALGDPGLDKLRGRAGRRGNKGGSRSLRAECGAHHYGNHAPGRDICAADRQGPECARRRDRKRRIVDRGSGRRDPQTDCP